MSRPVVFGIMHMNIAIAENRRFARPAERQMGTAVAQVTKEELEDLIDAATQSGAVGWENMSGRERSHEVRRTDNTIPWRF